MPVNVSLLRIAPSFPPLVSVHWSETGAQYEANVETEIQRENTDSCDCFFMRHAIRLHAQKCNTVFYEQFNSLTQIHVSQTSVDSTVINGLNQLSTFCNPSL